MQELHITTKYKRKKKKCILTNVSATKLLHNTQHSTDHALTIQLTWSLN